MLHVLEMVLQKILHKPDSFPQILRYQQEVLLSLSHLPSSYHSLLKLPAHFSGTDVSGLQCRYLQTLLLQDRLGAVLIQMRCFQLKSPVNMDQLLPVPALF